MRKFMNRSKTWAILGIILLTVASVSPAFANDVIENPVVVPPALGTNSFDITSVENTGFGSNLTLIDSSNNTFGVAGTPSDFNDLTRSNGNTIRSVGIATGTTTDRNVLIDSATNTIDGRSNSLTYSSKNTIKGDSNVLISDNIILSDSNTITGNFNKLTNSSSNTITNVPDNTTAASGNTLLTSHSNTITGNSNQLTLSNSNTVTGDLNQLTNTNSSSITGNSINITNGNFAKIVGNGVTAVGTGTTVTGDNTSALGNNTVVSAPNSVALGANSVADRANTVSVGSPLDQRQITNVANGTMPTDAVNMRQFDAANANNERMINHTGALAAALTGIMPLPYDPENRTQIGVGVGGYHGENAMAIGVNHYVNESLLVNAGMSFEGSERMWRGGLTWRMGHTTKVEPQVNTVEVDNLKSELQELKQQVAVLISERKADDAAKYNK